MILNSNYKFVLRKEMKFMLSGIIPLVIFIYFALLYFDNFEMLMSIESSYALSLLLLIKFVCFRHLNKNNLKHFLLIVYYFLFFIFFPLFFCSYLDWMVDKPVAMKLAGTIMFLVSIIFTLYFFYYFDILYVKMESIFNSIRSSDKLCENNKNIELILEYQKFTAFNENNRVKAKELKKLFNDYEFFIISNKYNINLYNNCLFFTPTEAIKIGNLKLNKSQNTIRSYYIEFLRDYHDMLERDIIEFPKKEVNRKLFYDFIWYNLLPEKRREEFIKQIT